jgi:hypothetical protein
MENIWGIKVSRIALPNKKLTEQEWVNKYKVSSNYRYNDNDSYKLNNQYDFSKLKTNKNEPTNAGA